MRFRARKRITLIPGLLYMNVTQSGVQSFTVKVWRYSWNSRTGQHRFDTPGWGGLVSRTRAQREKDAASRRAA